ncbi:unnamed protein product [Gemmata massiliana]|uniref:Uncharacterized protein n=1 Tax=Gemmata massiliana TaxID=1210884 RepID=A0A6P2DCG5_9BACT|nr:hypothetical protein [Gemmata massiliana]VTR98045.1 unnamed protein product [Gemmata massiliana]
MRTVVSIFAVLLLSASGSVAGADKPNNDRDPWNGFGIGSWVIRTESFTRGDTTEAQRERVTRVEAKDPGSIQLQARREGKKPGAFDGGESTSWHIPGYDPALDPKCKLLETSKQDLEIRGKKYACEVRTYDLTRGENKATATFWHSKDASAPYREFGGEPRTLAVRPDVLRLDVDYQDKERSMKTSVRVTNFSEERKVGEQKVVCVREEGEIEFSEGTMKGRGKMIAFLSNEVPGREVERIVEGDVGGTKFRKAYRVEAFETVKEK